MYALLLVAAICSNPVFLEMEQIAKDFKQQGLSEVQTTHNLQVIVPEAKRSAREITHIVYNDKSFKEVCNDTIQRDTKKTSD